MRSRQSLPPHELVRVGQRRTSGNRRGCWFDLMITTDKNLRYQQNLLKRRTSIIVLGTNFWPGIKRHLSDISAPVEAASPNSFQEIRMLSRKEFLRRPAGRLFGLSDVSTHSPVPDSVFFDFQQMEN